MGVPTAITLHGVNFDLGLAVRCRLSQGANVEMQPAALMTHANDTTAEINCTVGASPWASGDVAIHVALGPVDAHTPARPRRYPTPALSGLSPLVGVGESTVVAVYGTGLDGGTDRRCRFGDAEAPASVASDGPGGAASLRCLAPAVDAAGDVGVAITLNGAQYVAGGASLTFRYLAPGMVFVSAVSPPLGPLSGGTNVSVFGTNFANLPDSLTCLFGGGTVNATFVTASHLLCASPPAAATGEVLVRMSLNAQEFYAGAAFLYYAAADSVVALSPSAKGRTDGGTALVTLGAGLPDAVIQRGTFLCRFGDPPCGAPSAECAESAALLVAPNQVRCTVPTSPLAPDPLAVARGVQLWITANGAQFTLGPGAFVYFEVDPEVHAVTPPIGPIYGGTTIRVRGAGLTAGADDETLCRFTPSSSSSSSSSSSPSPVPRPKCPTACCASRRPRRLPPTRSWR